MQVNIPMEEEMFVNRITVSDLLDLDWSYDIEECMVTLQAPITEIDTFFDWYNIHIKVKDNGGKTSLDLFNGVAEKLLDTSTFKLVNRLYKSDM
ncbi:hypothetical protein RDI58_010604 [Solanum bulbocastanum]|uniref:Uncharacterized protein n=1 Tax=Solanum bulbocastanum TaxID=147425 RepID=A0AAN8TN85_SOLBU